MALIIPDVPENIYTLLLNAADSVDTTNRQLKTSLSHLNGMQQDTSKAVTNVTSTSQGLATDALNDVWTSTQVDFGVAADPLATFTSPGCLGGSPNPLLRAVEANKSAIQDGIAAIERRSAFRRTATSQQLSLEDTVEGIMQEQYEIGALGGGVMDILAALAPSVEMFIVSVPGMDQTLRMIVEWTLDIQNMEGALGNVALALEFMLLALNNLNNNGFSSGTCATGFVPGAPLPTFPSNIFMMKGKGSGGTGDPYENLADKYKNDPTLSNYTNIQIDNIVLEGEAQGLSPAQIEALLNSDFDGPALIQLLKDGKINSSNIDDVTALLSKGINGDTLTQLLNNGADLHDISANVTTLQNGGVRNELINNWLKNGTNLNDAIAVMKQGVDLNLIGTSSQVGDFTGLAGDTPNDILARIPADAKITNWKAIAGGAVDGMKFQWTDATGQTWRLEMHSPDPKYPRGWVLRVKRGSYYMDNNGNWYKDTSLNPGSGKYNPAGAAATHIPIQNP